MVVVTLLGSGSALFRLVCVLYRRVLTDDLFEQLKLLLHRVVDTRLDGRHRLQLPLKNRQRSAHWSLSRHIRSVEVNSASEPATFVNDLVQQLQQDLTWLLVRQRHDVVTHSPAWHVHVAELTRSDRRVIALAAQATGLETAGQVAQRTGIYQLANERSA